ncbi:hypothetical protein niasHT_000691 [Heterodera trifolii]|uniref:Uncharacterized protein n=1 Tax=Heterodera trifolii TaxID=157864 RepID=A0ABD2MCM8_9BILA
MVEMPANAKAKEATRLNRAIGHLLAAVVFLDRTVLYQIIGDLSREVGLPFTIGLTKAQLCHTLTNYYNFNIFHEQLLALQQTINARQDGNYTLRAALYKSH